MLDRYIGESMVLIINMNNGIKEPIRGYQNCNLNQILMFGEYVKMRESLYTRDIVWVNTILNHIDIRMILPSYESSCMMCTPKWYQRQKKILSNIYTHTRQKLWNLHYRYPNGIKKDNTNPTLLYIQQPPHEIAPTLAQPPNLPSNEKRVSLIFAVNLIYNNNSLKQREKTLNLIELF